MDEIRILSDVALLVNKPEYGLRRGDVGTVVEIGWSEQLQRPDFIVEFVDEETGKFYGSVFITDPDEIIALHFRRPRA